MRRYVMAAVVTAFVAAQALGAEYYVATTGSDTTGNGSPGAPYATINKALTLTEAGDTIWVGGGTYLNSRRMSMTVSGTEGAPIRVWAVPGAFPVLDFAGDGANNYGINISGSWWHVKGLKVQHASKGGIRIVKNTGVPQRNTVENCIAWANGNTGINISGTDGVPTGPSDNTILNCDSYENYDAITFGQNADGFGAKFTVGAGNKFIGCRAWNNADDGYDCWRADQAVTFEGCYAWSNGVNIWNDPNFEGNGNGFKLGERMGSHVLIRCAAWDQPVRGFDLNGNSSGVTLLNCTGVRSPRNFAFTNSDDNADKIVLRNCMSFDGLATMHVLADDQYNSWNVPPGVTIMAADFVSLDTAALEGPRNPDGSLPLAWSLRLAQTSEAIDAGMDIGLVYAGAAPDLGAFEAGDTDGDNMVDWFDMERLAEDWLAPGLLADIDISGSVNFVDYAIILQYWTQG